MTGAGSGREQTSIIFARKPGERTSRRAAIDSHIRSDETECVHGLLGGLEFTDENRRRIDERARQLVEAVRA